MYVQIGGGGSTDVDDVGRRKEPMDKDIIIRYTRTYLTNNNRWLISIGAHELTINTP